MTSNDLQSSILLKIGVDLLKISHHAKNLANPSKNVEDMAITNFGPKVSKSPPPLNLGQVRILLEFIAELTQLLVSKFLTLITDKFR